MQRINEEYGAIFEHLIAGTKSSSKKSRDPFERFDLSPISLLHVSYLLCLLLLFNYLI